MSVLVDTSVWSLAFRRQRPRSSPAVQALAELIDAGEAIMIGPIRQEVLSGYSDDRAFVQLRDLLDPFPDLPILRDDYIAAAELANAARRIGVQGSHTDFLICAMARRHECEILTTDRDFARFADAFELNLHPPPPR